MPGSSPRLSGPIRSSAWVRRFPDGSIFDSGTSPFAEIAQIDFILERGGKRQYRTEVAEKARAAAEIRLQIAQGTVDYTLGAEYQRQQSVQADGNQFGVFFSVPTPVFDRNQGEIARARRREQVQIDIKLRALKAEIRNELQNAYQRYVTADRVLRSISNDMIERARQVREMTESAYRHGRASFLEFVDAQRIFNDTRQYYNKARAEFARSLDRLDGAAGKTVSR